MGFLVSTVSTSSSTQLVYTGTLTAPLPEVRLSLSGKVPRGVKSDQRELADAEYKARMTAARVALSEDLYEGLPESLAKLRLSKGLSQVQLAKAVGTSQPHIAKIEAGKGDVLLETASRIADVLGVSIDHLRTLLSNKQIYVDSSVIPKTVGVSR